jgi:hypothetical protein
MFTPAEMNLIVIYDTGTRIGLIKELEGMIPYLTQDEADLYRLTQSVITKLKDMTNAAYTSLYQFPDTINGLR